MSLQPEDRYKSAREMRHALEQIYIDKNWLEKTLPNGIKWACSWKDKYYEVSRIQVGNSWSVIIKKGTSKNTLRHDNQLSKTNLNQKEAKRISQKILQNFVAGKLK